jgi:hypothetical protein
MRVKNFMRELELIPTKWEENIAALAEKGSMGVEEFLATDPITFGEKFWGGKHDWKYNRVKKLLGESTYYQMLHYYHKTPAQLAVKAYEDAKVAAIKEQKALGLTTYMSLSAEDKTGWERVFAENKAERALRLAEATENQRQQLSHASSLPPPPPLAPVDVLEDNKEWHKEWKAQHEKAMEQKAAEDRAFAEKQAAKAELAEQEEARKFKDSVPLPTTVEQRVEEIDTFFLENTSRRSLSLIDSAKLKIRVANKALNNFENNIGMYEDILGNKSEEEREASVENAKKIMISWKEGAEKELADLESQFAVVKCEWECPTCTAVWRTG